MIAHAMTGLAVVTCALALWKGSGAERETALLLMVAWVASLCAQALCVRTWGLRAFVITPYAMAAVDLAFGVGLVVVMLRHAARWLTLALLVQSCALVLHALYLGGDGGDGQAYVARENALSVVILVLLLSATVSIWMRRGRGHTYASDPRPTEGVAHSAG